MGILNLIKICVASVPQAYFLYICSHHFFGAVTFEHVINVIELKYKLGFIIYHVEDMVSYLRLEIVTSVPPVASVPLNLSKPQSFQ